MEPPFSARAALLAELCHGEGYGLELLERIRQRTGVTIGNGSLYPALRGLEDEGLVTSREAAADPVRGGRPRRFYTITADGLRTARDQADKALALFSLAVAR